MSLLWDVQFMLLHARFALGIWTLFQGPGSGSLVRYSSPEQHKNTDFSRNDFQKMFPYSSYDLVHSGYKYVRQSTVALGRISHISYVQVDSGP